MNGPMTLLAVSLIIISFFAGLAVKATEFEIDCTMMQMTRAAGGLIKCEVVA